VELSGAVSGPGRGPDSAPTLERRRRRIRPRPEEWLAALFAAATALLFVALDLPFSVVSIGREYAKFLLAILAVSLPIWLAARAIELARKRLDLRAAGLDLAEIGRSLAAFWVVLIAYTHLKSRIATLRPHLLDELLRDLDSVLHPIGNGDFLAWVLSFTRDPADGTFWSLVYFFAWAALALPYGIAFARGGGAAVRRINCALALAYVAGSIVYLAVPALGPGFAFRPEFEHLQGTPAFAVQESMLRSYLYAASHPEARAVPFAGIAAFPSLHLATTGLGLFVAARWAKPLLVLLIPWNLAIAWSALYFGWHYAIDFYPGMLLAWGGWWLAGRWTERPGPVPVGAAGPSAPAAT
jgi:membrane-associated phospholipid phosphatase